MAANQSQKMKSKRVKAAPSFDRRTIPADASEYLWTTADGWQLRRLNWPASSPRGSILFMTGRGDFYEKYLEAFHDFHQQGWDVTSADWRGQGGSGRCSPDPHIGHIEDFSIWVDDLAALFDDWRASCPPPHIVIGHSMGGHIVLRAMVENRIMPDAAIFSAPMLALIGSGTPDWIAQSVIKFLCRIGKSQQRAWKVSEKPLEPEVSRQRLLTHDAERYADEFFWFRERPFVRLGPASWRWVERAYASSHRLRNRVKLQAMKIPALFLATSADELVDHSMIERAVHILPNAEMTLFGEESAHEILREVDDVRNIALASCFEFLDRVAPKP